MSKLTCTDEMYQAFVAEFSKASASEPLEDMIKNGVEAALGAMPVEVVGWQAMHEGELQFCRQKDFHGFPLESEPEPLFTHPDANTVNREVERQLRLFAHALKGLCKDFSDLRDRPYMGDVTAAVDGLLEQHVECLEIDEASKPSYMEPSTLARMALGIPWRDVESQARQVAEQAAERINLMNGVGAPKPQSTDRKGKGGHVCSCETPCPLPAMPRSRYMQLQNGKGQLTADERAAGWFFDDDYDGLLANRKWPGHEGFWNGPSSS